MNILFVLTLIKDSENQPFSTSMLCKELWSVDDRLPHRDVLLFRITIFSSECIGWFPSLVLVAKKRTLSHCDPRRWPLICC